MSSIYIKYPASMSGPGTGDFVGPGSSTDKAVVRFNGTTGKLAQNSVVIISDTGAITGVLTLAASSSVTANSVIVGSAANTISGLATIINGAGTLTLPTSTDTLVGKATTDVLTNKTLSGNTAVTLISGSGTLTLNTSGTVTLPNATDTLVGKATTDTLTNKTLTSPVINTPTGIVKGDVGLGNVDNTSDATKNAAAVTLTNKTLTSPVINGGTLTGPFAISTSVSYTVNANSNRLISLDNADNTGGGSIWGASVGGTSAGDPYFRADITGGLSWSFGGDNSDSDKFKVSQASALGSNDYFMIDANGLCTHGASGGTQAHLFNGSVSITKSAIFTRTDVASTATINQLSSASGFVYLTGSTATTVNGILAGTDGQTLILINRTGSALTVTNLNGAASSADQIETQTGASFTTTANGAAFFIYSSTASKWQFISGQT